MLNFKNVVLIIISVMVVVFNCYTHYECVATTEMVVHPGECLETLIVRAAKEGGIENYDYYLSKDMTLANNNDIEIGSLKVGQKIKVRIMKDTAPTLKEVLNF